MVNAQTHALSRYAPRHWPLWAALGLGRLTALLPQALLLRLGALVGALFGRLSAHRRRVVATNLRLCFPDLDAAEREALQAAHFRSLGAGVFETCVAWWASDRAVARLGEVHGLEHLDRALAEGRGVILLTGHFTCLELGARLVALQRPFHAMYRPHDNAVYQGVMRAQRERRSGLPPLARSDLRGVLRALRGGRTVWYAPDQNLGSEDGVFAPFFGVPTHTITATARLARMTGARVVPYFPRRQPDGRYRVEILSPMDDFPSDDAVADAARVNALIEAAVRGCPGQYYWVHRRFKTRPEGEASPYA